MVKVLLLLIIIIIDIHKSIVKETMQYWRFFVFVFVLMYENKQIGDK